MIINGLSTIERREKLSKKYNVVRIYLDYFFLNKKKLSLILITKKSPYNINYLYNF